MEKATLEFMKRIREMAKIAKSILWYDEFDKQVKHMESNLLANLSQDGE